MPATIRVAEVFDSIQGEGAWTGTPCTFVRFQGCNMACAYCDQPEAQTFSGGREVESEDLVKEVLSRGQKHVVLTGGEPLECGMFGSFAWALMLKDKAIHIETNGWPIGRTETMMDTLNPAKAKRMVTHRPWWTWSPHSLKHWIQGQALLWSEVKCVVSSRHEAEEFNRTRSILAPKRCYFQPEWKHERNVVPEIVDFLRTHNDWKLSIQMHKHIGAS